MVKAGEKGGSGEKIPTKRSIHTVVYQDKNGGSGKVGP